MMPRNALLFTLSLLLLSPAALLAQDEAPPKRDLPATAQSIQTTFGLYRQAVADQKGADAVALVNQETLDYFGVLQDLALYGTPQEVEGRSITDRMQVVALRHRVPLSTLEEVSPEGLLAFCVETGLLGKSISAVEISEIRLDGNAAKANTVINGQPLPVVLRFTEEDGGWKIDLRPILEAGNDALREVAEKQGVTADDLILQLVSKGSGVEVTKEIWQPLLSRDDEAPAP
jgi:hypothetical protein